MSFLNSNKCYAQQPQRLEKTQLRTLPDHWLTDFYQILAVQLKLEDKAGHEVFNHRTNQTRILTQKESFFIELDRHVGEHSSYVLKSQLLESLATLYAIFTHPKTSNEQKNFIASRIAEDVKECSSGFTDRVNYAISLCNMPQNLAELVAQVRFKLVDRLASIFAAKNPQGVHVHTRVFQVASETGLGVWPINGSDLYLNTGSSDHSDEDINKMLQTGFNNHFQLFALLNAMCAQIEALIAAHGYQGKRALDNDYQYEMYAKFCECCNLFIPIKMIELFKTEEKSSKITDINWQNVKYALLQQLNSEDYVTLSQEQAAIILNEDSKSLMTLIAHVYEFVACLEFFSEWPLEQKVAFVLSYLDDKPPNEQKEALTILHNEATQLTALLKTESRIQSLYFEIAITEKDVSAVRTYVEQNADINAALLLLFNEEFKRETLYWLHKRPALIQKLTITGMNTVVTQGKYQGKTIAEILISTRKGRQLLLENETLQTILSETAIACTLANTLELARTEKNTTKTQVGFFKQVHPEAIQLVQHIVYGDLKNSEDLLIINSHLLRILLSEKVTVKDYSRRKIKQTAFQAALCAMDNELIEMLSQHMTEEEKNSQYQAVFPQGHQAYYQEQVAFDFTQIVDAISNSERADVEKALNLELPNNTYLWKSLEEFRQDFTKRSYQEPVFNPQHLLKAFVHYDEKYNNWNKKQQQLFWRQVIGYVQRFLPANIAMDVAQGLCYWEKGKSKRSFSFKWNDSHSIFPLVFDSLSGLGYEFAVLSSGGKGMWCDLSPQRKSGLHEYFRNYLCQAKTPIFGELCSQDRAAAISTRV